ncbi:putative E3 ubiquitin-protein ligase UBR7 [Myripristis murdjan]|uniref:Putative E3 ubiquitin-protein ligase UBR7 n=1 Tax=Myripristis murdjan TaxID=586833 RepID=A0A668ALX0_9TELE|nr:putative E3 ubiquitin-protein ligase UBR7 [Myripristis murdjan]
MAVNKDDSTVTLGDILADEDELREALCVLAGSDPENCSYSQGYVKRQAVFACSTCTPSGAEPAGLCLACANKCHDGHNIFELYTKRNFRCDCGNDKFGDFQCQLIPTKESQNVKNQYNHNFHGTYCSCDRPYPDTDDQVNDEMIQCIICEDWFHTRHLGCTVVESEELQEMVCDACMNKAPFLWTYAAHIAAPPVIKVSHHEEEVEVNVEEKGEEEAKRCDPCEHGAEGSSSSADSNTQEKETANRRSPCKRAHQEMTGSSAKSKSGACRLKELQARGLERPREGAVFWPYSWRSELCTCVSCKRAYVDVGVQFLLDESDTVLAYENRGRTEPFGQDPLMSFLSSMDHVQQLEMIYHYNDLKTELLAFLQQFAIEGKVVTAEAIQQFFEGLQSRKRRRTNAGYQ